MSSFCVNMFSFIRGILVYLGEIYRSYNRYSILTFSQIVFQSDGTIFHPHKQCTGIQFFLTNIYFLVVFNNCYPSDLILICNFLMLSDVERLFR